MLRRAALTLISLLAITTAASAQYYPQQNGNQPHGTYFCPQHNTYCNHSQAPTGPSYNTNQQKCPPVGNVPAGYHYCQTHNQYCNHAPLNDPRYTNNNGYYQNGQYYYNNNGQYQGNGQYNNGRYNNGRYNNNNNNNNVRRGHRGNNSLRNQTPPPGHYYCETHNMFCSHQ